MISHTDTNHTYTATFPTKHTYTYIKKIGEKNVYFVQKADRDVPPPWDDRYVTACITALARARQIQINTFPLFFCGGGVVSFCV